MTTQFLKAMLFITAIGMGNYSLANTSKTKEDKHRKSGQRSEPGGFWVSEFNPKTPDVQTIHYYSAQQEKIMSETICPKLKLHKGRHQKYLNERLRTAIDDFKSSKSNQTK
jgi:hypothetical protein